MLTDKRYSIAREFTGAEVPRWVVRFCGEWISDHGRRPEALEAALNHQAQRIKRLTQLESSEPDHSTLDPMLQPALF